MIIEIRWMISVLQKKFNHIQYTHTMPGQGFITTRLNMFYFILLTLLVYGFIPLVVLSIRQMHVFQLQTVFSFLMLIGLHSFLSFSILFRVFVLHWFFCSYIILVALNIWRFYAELLLTTHWNFHLFFLK